MEEENPIARHLKFQMSTVTTSRFFLGLCEYRTHTRMRHVSLNRNVRAGNRFAGCVGQLENDRSRADPGWFRRDLVLNRDRTWRLGRSGTAGHEQSCRTGEPYEDSICSKAYSPIVPVPALKKTLLAQAASAAAWRSHSHVQAIFPCSPSGGNMW
jgi:hypothetical protein